MNWNTGFIDNLDTRWRLELNDLYEQIVAWGDWAGFHEYLNTSFYDSVEHPIFVGRYRYVKNRFPALRCAITEFGFDSHEPNPQYDGYHNHVDLWRRMYPNLTPLEVMTASYSMADRLFYSRDSVPILVFARGHNKTPRWTAYNYQNDTDLINWFKTYRRRPMINIPPPTTMGKLARVIKLPGTTTRREIRSQPASSASDVGDLLVGHEVTLFHLSPANGNWMYTIGPGGTGWSEMTGVLFEDINPANGEEIPVEVVNAVLTELETISSAIQRIHQLFDPFVPG
jgi:hypothetical protein